MTKTPRLKKDGTPYAARKASAKKTGPKGVTKDPLADATYKNLIGMIKILCTKEEICGILEMSGDTLDRRLKERGAQNFADLYAKYGGQGKQSLRRLQFQQAETSVAMSMHLGKHHLGQTEKQAPQQTTIILNGSADDL
tara:strand:+ start:13027 stop:13443 length:417 start_codon:yes stop_codon:yes gene_type:complete